MDLSQISLYLNDIILGFVQGFTEFLPISSSGHLVLTREILGITGQNDLAYDAVLQLSTVLAVIIYFSPDLLKIFITKRVYVLYLLLGTLPAVFFGVLLESYIGTVFRDTDIVILTLILGGIVMLVAEKIYKERSSDDLVEKDISYMSALWVGFFQVLALIPGMSRSGMTISGGLFAGLSRSLATRFSFLLSIPIILGTGCKKLFDLYREEGEGLWGAIDFGLLLGSATAFLTGLLAIHFLIKYLKNHTLKVFVWYRSILVFVLIALFSYTKFF